MPDYTPKQLVDAARRAEASGDTAAAERLKAAARKAIGQPSAGPKALTFGNAAVDTYADFGRGVTSGLKKAARFGTEIVGRGLSALGADALGGAIVKQVDNRRAVDADSMAAYRERSPWAVGGGELVGEALFTAPVGAAGALAGKATLSGASRLLTGSAAKAGTFKMGGAALVGEGAAVGAYMSGGEDVLDHAAIGGAVGLGTGALINGVTKAGGVLLRDRLNSGRAQGAVADALTTATQRIDDAANFGGYDLDGATAMATRRSADELSRLRNDPEVGPRILGHQANVEKSIVQRATSLAGRYGSTSDPSAYEGAGLNVQRSLTALRMADERGYKNLYKQFDRMAAETDTYIDTQGLGVRLNALRADSTNVAKEGFMAKIDKQLAQYGIVLTNSSPMAAPAAVYEEAPSATNLLTRKPGTAASRTTGSLPLTGKPSATAPGTTEIPSNKPAGSGSPSYKNLSLENLEDLVSDLNEFWSASLSPAKKRYLGQVKSEVSNYIDTALKDVGEKAGVGAEVYRMGEAARTARRAFSEKWQSKDIIDKITTRTDGGEFAIDYTKVLGKLESKDVATVKARLLGTAGGQKAWKSMQQAPLLEALAAATQDTSESVMEGGVIKFNHKAFERALDRALPTRDARTTLWGKDMVDEMDRTIASWKDRYRKPDTSGSLNPSGTALTLLKQLRCLPTGKSRNIGMAVSGSLPVIGNALKRGAREEAVDTLLSGRGIPNDIQNEMITDALMNFEKQFIGAGGQKYGDLLRSIARPGAVLVITDSND